MSCCKRRYVNFTEADSSQDNSSGSKRELHITMEIKKPDAWNPTISLLLLEIVKRNDT